MNFSKFKKRVISVLGACLMVAPIMAESYKLKLQSSDPSGSINYHANLKWAERVKTMSDGRLIIKMLPVGAIVKYSETLDAIGAGIIDGHVSTVAYFSGKEPAFGLLANPVGAWGDPNEMFMFIEYGGGRELYEELLEPYGVQFLGAVTPGLESFLSNKPLRGVDDLKGLKLRAPEGMVSSVFAAAGANPVNLPGSEVYTALDKGVIDAADYSAFSTNDSLGMHKVAKFPVYPGFHSMPTVDISITKRKWDKMPTDLRTILKSSIRDFATLHANNIKISDKKAVANHLKSGGSITNWSDQDRSKFRSIAAAEWKKFSKKSANAKKVYDILTKFLIENGMME